MFKKIITFLLYTLPVVFFTICYFLIITSGEDIFQGANSQPDIINDSISAFNHSARLADMYAWSSINFFDYTFQFGPDIIFRLIDVVLAFLTFYLATYIALGRHPKFRLKDASVFAGIFLMIFLTSYGTTLYGGFSKIHNYLIISIVSLAFGLCFVKDLLHQKLPQKWWFIIFMLIFGFIFGLTSSVTAVAFLLCSPVYLIYLKLSKQKIVLKKFLFSWRGASVVGIIAALLCIYVFGPGLADYDTNPIYQAVGDYLPLKDIFVNVGNSAKRILLHNAFNFGRFLAPFIVITIPITIYGLILKKKGQLAIPKFSRSEKNFLFAIFTFIILHILALSQIYYFTRMVLPVYLVGLSVYFYVVLKLFQNAKILLPLALVEIILITVIISIRTIFAVNYLQKVTPILDQIKNSNEQNLCVTAEQAKSKNLPYIYLGQEDFLVDWAMPQTIYGKTINYCE